MKKTVTPKIILNNLKTWVSDPHTITGLLFLGLVLSGSLRWHWGHEPLAYILLLYFVISLGIRLDEIVKRLDEIENRLIDLTRSAASQAFQQKDQLQKVSSQLETQAKEETAAEPP